MRSLLDPFAKLDTFSADMDAPASSPSGSRNGRAHAKRRFPFLYLLPVALGVLGMGGNVAHLRGAPPGGAGIWATDRDQDISTAMPIRCDPFLHVALQSSYRSVARLRKKLAGAPAAEAQKDKDALNRYIANYNETAQEGSPTVFDGTILPRLIPTVK